VPGSVPMPGNVCPQGQLQGRFNYPVAQALNRAGPFFDFTTY